MKLTGVSYSVKFEQAIDLRRQYIICANHSSFMDVTAMIAGIPAFFLIMAKSNLKNIPVIGYFVRNLDIIVDQDNPISSARAYVNASRALRAGISILIFPEGGVEPTPYHLRDIKEGAFYLAYREKVPVLPVTLLGTWDVLPSDRMEASPGHVQIIVHAPVHISQVKDANELKTKVCMDIESPLKPFSKRSNKETQEPIPKFGAALSSNLSGSI